MLKFTVCFTVLQVMLKIEKSEQEKQSASRRKNARKKLSNSFSDWDVVQASGHALDSRKGCLCQCPAESGECYHIHSKLIALLVKLFYCSGLLCVSQTMCKHSAMHEHTHRQTHTHNGM